MDTLEPPSYSHARKASLTAMANRREILLRSTVARDDIPPDYVLLFRLPSKSPGDGQDQLERLIRCLSGVQLEVECRYGGKGAVLVFVRCPEDFVRALVWKTRYAEFAQGVRHFDEAEGKLNMSVDDIVTEAERLRVIYTLITTPVKDGGAGVTPGLHEWAYVESISPVPNDDFTTEWLKTWSREWLVSDADFTELRNHYGEKVTLYFAFTQFYTVSLIPLSIVGVIAHFFLRPYHPFYAVVMVLWTIGFKHAWERRQRELAVQWGVKGFTKLAEQRRAAFVSEGERNDPITGRKVAWFPMWKLILRRLLFVPFGVFSAVALTAVLTLIFAIEVYLDEVYDGPLKQYLVYAPTMFFSILFNVFSNFYTYISKSLTDYENHRTNEGFENAMTQKIFVLTFLTGYMSLFLTAYLYVPFGNYIVPKLDVLALLSGVESRAARSFAVDSLRLRQQVMYLAATGQFLQAVEEYFIPYIARKAKKVTHISEVCSTAYDRPEERDFLDRVRRDVELPEYEIYEDYAEMVVQFGLIALWSVAWPLTPFACVVNNFMEVRTDSVKICMSQRRPIPLRAHSIGPWLDSIAFLSWLGALTTSTLVFYYFARDNGASFAFDKTTVIWLLAILIVAEHGYWIIDRLLRELNRRLKTTGELDVLREEWFLRRRHLRHIGVLDNQVLGDSVVVDRSQISSDFPRGFWTKKNVDKTVSEAKEILCMTADKKKIS